MNSRERRRERGRRRDEGGKGEGLVVGLDVFKPVIVDCGLKLERSILCACREGKGREEQMKYVTLFLTSNSSLYSCITLANGKGEGKGRGRDFTTVNHIAIIQIRGWGEREK